MAFLGLGWLLAWPRMGLLCCSPGQCHPHLGIKQAAVRGQAGSLVAELSREGRGLWGQEVLSDAHGAHQALHLCQKGGGQRLSGYTGSGILPLSLLPPRSTSHDDPHPTLRERGPGSSSRDLKGHGQNQAKGRPERAQAGWASEDTMPSRAR